VSTTPAVSPSSISILSSTHGRMRRAERSIQKRDLQAALRYGTKERSINDRGKLCYKFRFADIVYITDETCTREITSWAAPGSGIDVPSEEISPQLQRRHDVASETILKKMHWTSHTVIIVDQSGSMRKADVDGGVTRSDAVWLSLAIDFVRKQLDRGEATSTDVVSIIIMNSASKVVVDRQPMDWLLYNRIIELLRSQEPCFDGNYGPALDRAEDLLAFNIEGSFALSLFFLSDGRPSDRILRGFHPRTYHSEMVRERIDALLSRFGRRLSVVAVGFGRPGEDFNVLEMLASRPSKFGGIGEFCTSDLKVTGLVKAFSSLISSTMATKTELSELGGSKQRPIRIVKREPNDTADEYYLSDDWYSYKMDYLVSCETWSDTSSKWKQQPLHSRAAAGVAYRKKFFGEGAERLVAKFREINKNDFFVGPLLVAKESRFQVESDDDPKEFHKVFCKTQARAQAVAEEFNKRLDAIPGMPKSIPRIQFLNCSVYTVYDYELGTIGVLVEEQLDPVKYKKWNDNKGGIEGRAPDFAAAPAAGSIMPGPMAAIAESDEEDEEEEDDDDNDDDDDDDDDDDKYVCNTNPASPSIKDDDIPQAFSHFSYHWSKRKQLICDLQGVLDESIVPPLFKFTDPVVHHRSKTGRKNVYGRTDRGADGTDDFFKTHVCSELCRMIKRTWVRTHEKE